MIAPKPPAKPTGHTSVAFTEGNMQVTYAKQTGPFDGLGELDIQKQFEDKSIRLMAR